MEDELMHRMIPAVAIALGLSVTVAAQDTTIRSKTRVSGDDAQTITLTGCLERGAGSLFTLKGTSAVSRDDVTTRSKVEKDVDDNGAEVTTKARTEVDREGHDAGHGLVATYELTPQQGVDLAAHAGKQVQITAVALTAKNGDDDAEVKVEERTKIEREGAPDSQVKSRTEASLPRGEHPRVAVLSVKPLGAACK
jgi:hypothetical protein